MMNFFRKGMVTAGIVGALWAVIAVITIAVALSFATGEGYRPSMIGSLVFGFIAGQLTIFLKKPYILMALLAVLGIVISYTPLTPIIISDDVTGLFGELVTGIFIGLVTIIPLINMLQEVAPGPLTRHAFEDAVIRFLTGFGYVIFTAIVLIPFYVMVMTSLKSQQALLQNPLDFSIDLSRGMDLFRSYFELFQEINFGSFLWTSFYVSVLTVFITLLFSVPGAYAVARLNFKGRAAFSRSILLIYMVPMIVLALPIYIVFSMTGLRNTVPGLILIYPVTTIPVALYMLQGYFRGLPAEIEEAGLMDGLSRLQVIWKITLPLSLPAMVSVSLYVFMIAWNEFLLAFMLLDDPSKFTLTRGVSMLNSSEIPRQHLMAGAVIATVPIMALFLGLERFMTKGLTAGSVKG
jgi:multiple sugar transport system permease protein